jgi:hypothetical protein
LKDLMSRSPSEGAVLVKTQKSLRHAISRIGVPAGVPRPEAAGEARPRSRAQANGGILIAVVLLATLVTATAVSSIHRAGDHFNSYGHQPVAQAAFVARGRSAPSCGGRGMPWMYVATTEPGTPWMYAATVRPGTPWMYAATSHCGMPWMYGEVVA